MTCRSEYLLSSLLVLISMLLISMGTAVGQAPPGDVSKAVDAARTDGVSEKLLARLMALGVEHRLEPETMTDYVQVISHAQRDKLPVSCFVEKIEEGLAKRIPPTRIQAVLEKKMDNYLFSQQVLTKVLIPKANDSTYRPEDLIPLANCLDMGLPPHKLAVFLKNAPPAPMDMLLTAAENLAMLCQIGFDKQLSVDILTTGLTHKGLTPQWRNLPSVIATARAKGMSDARIAAVASDSLKKGQSLAAMMAELGFTARNLRHGPQTGPLKK